MGRKRNRSQRRSQSPAVMRPATAVGAPDGNAAILADISLPPWLRAWFARHGAAAAVCGLLALLVAVVFGQTLWHDFLDMDDFEYVLNNPHVRERISIRGIAWAFTQRYAANWHPLTWISHMLDCQMYGLWAGGHHLTSVLLHAATAILLFLALRRMTGRLGVQRPGGGAVCRPSPAGGVGGLGGRAEGRVERLVLRAHAVGLCRLCTTAFSLAAVCPGRGGCFTLGLMAKPMLVTLPFVLLLLDYWPLGTVEAGSTRWQPSRQSRQ